MNGRHSDRQVPGLLAAVVVLLAIIAIELAVLISPGPSVANAQIPDTALQRKQIVEETARTSRKLDELIQFLRTGVLKVRVVGTDNPKESVPAPATTAEPRKDRPTIPTERTR